MAKFTIKGGKLTAEVYVQVTRDHTCACGQEMNLTMNMPDGLTVTGIINVNGVYCPSCRAQVVIPDGHHYVENFKLLSDLKH